MKNLYIPETQCLNIKIKKVALDNYSRQTSDAKLKIGALKDFSVNSSIITDKLIYESLLTRELYTLTDVKDVELEINEREEDHGSNNIASRTQIMHFNKKFYSSSTPINNVNQVKSTKFHENPTIIHKKFNSDPDISSNSRYSNGNQRLSLITKNSMNDERIKNHLLEKYLEMKLQADFYFKERKTAMDLIRNYNKHLSCLRKDRIEFEAMKKRQAFEILKEKERLSRRSQLQLNNVKNMMKNHPLETKPIDKVSTSKLANLENKIKILELDLKRERGRNKARTNGHNVQAASSVANYHMELPKLVESIAKPSKSSETVTKERDVKQGVVTFANIEAMADTVPENTVFNLPNTPKITPADLYDGTDDSKSGPAILRDGTLVTRSQDGATKIYTFVDGRREIHAREWKKKIYPDGTVKVVYLKDKNKEIIYPDGRKEPIS